MPEARDTRKNNCDSNNHGVLAVEPGGNNGGRSARSAVPNVSGAGVPDAALNVCRGVANDCPSVGPADSCGSRAIHHPARHPPTPGRPQRAAL